MRNGQWELIGEVQLVASTPDGCGTRNFPLGSRVLGHLAARDKIDFAAVQIRKIGQIVKPYRVGSR
jgi:hypothetical protein